MKRGLVKLVVFLLLGAIVNVAVAWGFTLVHQHRLQTYPLMSVVAALAATVPSGTMPAEIVRVYEEDHSGFGFEQSVEFPREMLTSRFSSGWPRKSMKGDLLTSTAGMVTAWPNAVIALPRSSWLIPVVVIWPGFAINTVFYAGILWLLFAAPFALRRRIRGGRIRRGLCPACAYPVGDSPVCTECGKAIAARGKA